MKNAAGRGVSVNQFHNGVRDVVDRNQVGVSDLGYRDRQDRRQFRQLGEQWKKVVRAIDLVCRAGLGVPDHGSRAVHPPVGGAAANQFLGLELGAVIRRRKVLPLVEIVLGERPSVVTCHCDRRDVVQTSAGPFRQFDHRRRSGDIGRGLLVSRREVVDGTEMQNVIDVGRNVFQTEPGFDEIADQWADSVAAVQSVGQLLESSDRLRSNEYMDEGVRITSEKSGQHVLTQKPGTAGHDVARHARRPYSSVSLTASCNEQGRCGRRGSDR